MPESSELILKDKSIVQFYPNKNAYTERQCTTAHSPKRSKNVTPMKVGVLCFQVDVPRDDVWD